MASGHSQGVMAFFLTISVYFSKYVTPAFVKYFTPILILASIVVHISMTNSNTSQKLVRRLFKISITERL